jgi:membrane-associated protein
VIHNLFDIILHLDQHLNGWAGQLGPWTYGLLFVIIFCETGLVVTPFLPGDSLLFAMGALAAHPESPIDLPLACVILCAAANCGDLVNYSIGRKLGPRVFSRESNWLLNKKHLLEAHGFYERHGRKTIVLARFVPIIRTFAPFVAGVGQMSFARFIGFSIGGGVLWVVTVSLAGYWFGRIPAVRDHFELVVLAIIAISLAPVAWHAIRSGRSKKTGRDEVREATAAGESVERR